MSKIILEEENSLFIAHFRSCLPSDAASYPRKQNSQLRQCENVKTYNLEEAGILTFKN